MNRIKHNSLGWDVVNWSRSLDFFNKELADFDFHSAKAVEVGCGALSGGIGLWLASKGADVTSTSNMDVAEATGKYFNDSGLGDSYSFEIWDASKPWQGDPVDIICFKSVLGGIRRAAGKEDLERFLSQVNSALKPGGLILFAENMAAGKFHQMMRAKFGAGRNEWYYFSFEELLRTLEDAGFADVRTGSTGFTGAFGRSNWQRNLLGAVDGIICPLIPQQLHYVGFGIAVKK